MMALFSLIIPTYNRPQFAERILTYYAKKRVKYHIYVADASRPEDAAINQQTVRLFMDRLTVTYLAWPNMSVGDSFEKFGTMIDTPYCGFVADDDFLIPEGVDQCITFLEQNPQETIVHGKGMLAGVLGDGAYGTLCDSCMYPQSVLKETSAAGRLQEYFEKSLYAILFSVQRTTNWREMFQGVSVMKGVNHRNLFKDEILPSAVCAVRTPIRELDCLTLVRQGHSGIYPQPSMYNWITDEQWYPSFSFFRQRLVQQISVLDHLSQEQALKIVNDVFSSYLMRQIIATAAPKKLVSKGRISGLKEKLKSLLGSEMYTRLVIWRRSGKELSLHQIRNPQHPYYQVFNDIEMVINKGA